jgi:type VI secretion system VasD/TssJ family lipoprotein
MICRYRTLGLGWTFVGALVAVNCGKAPPPAPPSITIAAPPDARVKAPMTLAASADTNPDATGRPSPVVVRVVSAADRRRIRRGGFFRAVR